MKRRVRSNKRKVSNQLAGNLSNARIQSANGMVLNLYKASKGSLRKTLSSTRGPVFAQITGALLSGVPALCVIYRRFLLV